jgi:hypothetical protein
MFSTFIHILKHPKNIIALVFGSFITFTILRILPVFEILKNSYKIPNIGIARKFDLFWDYSFRSFCDISSGEQFLILVLSILTPFNIILFIIFVRRQRRMLSKRSFAASVSGMLLGLFGVGCLSCGVLILAPLITFLGLGAYLGNFAQYAITISYVGMILVIISSIYLLKKISEPFICVSE